MRAWDRLTASFVKGLKKPGKFHDGGGLMLQATPTKLKGVVTKAWLFRFQLDHRKRAMGLGSARTVSLGEARAKATECRRLLAAGVDPIAHRDAQRMAARAAELHTATFRQCVDGFLASRGDGWRQKHAAQWRNSMATYAKALDDVAVGDIDTAMVLRCIEPEWKRAPKTLDRVRARIGEVLGWAEARGYRQPGPLPTRWRDHLSKLLPHPRSLQPVEHHPAMGYNEVPSLFAKLIATDSVPELCLAFAILTASRSVEARGARLDEIDFKTKVWTVPPSRMKRSREHRVPLSSEALALIERLPRTGEYLFAINGNKPIVGMSLRKALRRHAGDAFTVHGFRSAFRDWGSERSGAPRELLEVALSHHLGSAVEQAYARSDMLERRRAIMEQWARHCATPTGPGSEKVVPLRGGRRG